MLQGSQVELKWRVLVCAYDVIIEKRKESREENITVACIGEGSLKKNGLQSSNFYCKNKIFIFINSEY